MCTSQQIDLFNRNGYVAVSVMSGKQADSLAECVLQEGLQIALQGENIEQLAQKVRPSLLLNNPTLRAKYLQNPSCVWHDGNTRHPHISKNCGMCNIYHNPRVRDEISFSPRVYAVISALYQWLTKTSNDPVYLLGPDRVGIKVCTAVFFALYSFIYTYDLLVLRVRLIYLACFFS
jgi:hypothetical protein